MTKWKEIKDKPVTWGGYAKLCGIAMAAGTIVSAVNVVSIIGVDTIKDGIHDFFGKIKKNKTEEE